MRLDLPFTRLPLRFDHLALAAEVARVPEEVWQAHPSGFPGNDALLLVSQEGDPEDDATYGRMRPTPVLAQLPYIRQVLAGLEAVIGRTRLMRIAPAAEASPHIDTAYYWWDRARVHVPIETNPGVEFHCGDEHIHMAAGECWVFDTWRTHRVTNPGPVARIHLVVDTVGSHAFWDLVERGPSGAGRGGPAGAAPPRRGAPAPLRVDQPARGHVAVGARRQGRRGAARPLPHRARRVGRAAGGPSPRPRGLAGGMGRAR